MASGIPSVHQRKLGPAPIASFEDLSDEVENVSPSLCPPWVSSLSRLLFERGYRSKVRVCKVVEDLVDRGINVRARLPRRKKVRSSVCPREPVGVRHICACRVHQPSTNQPTNQPLNHTPVTVTRRQNQPYEFECRGNRLRECQASSRSPRRQRLVVRLRHPARRELTSAGRAVPPTMRTVTPGTLRPRGNSLQVLRSLSFNVVQCRYVTVKSKL